MLEWLDIQASVVLLLLTIQDTKLILETHCVLLYLICIKTPCKEFIKKIASRNRVDLWYI